MALDAPEDDCANNGCQATGEGITEKDRNGTHDLRNTARTI